MPGSSTVTPSTQRRRPRWVGRVAGALAVSGVLASGGPVAAQGHRAVPPCHVVDHAHRAGAAERVGLVQTSLWLYLRAYQMVVSPGDGARCSLYPTCSGYAVRALRHAGPVRGVWLAAARVTSDHRDPSLPLCRAGGRVYRYAPPEQDT